MQFSKPPSTESARYLWSIRRETSGSGVRSRWGTTRFALFGMPQSAEQKVTKDILLDHNKAKIIHAEEVFSCGLELVDPLSIHHAARYRIMLLLTAILPDSLRGLLVAWIHTKNLASWLPTDSKLYLWNPYTMLHFVLSERLLIHSVFYLTVAYPPLRQTSKTYASKRAHELLRTDPQLMVISEQSSTFLSSDVWCSIYMTQLHGLSVLESEKRLLDFARKLRSVCRTQVKIFLHYLDRDLSDNQLESILGDLAELVSREDSLDTLSTRQLSFSASSTIGLDLLSKGVCHFIVANPTNGGREVVGDWRWRLSRGDAEVLWMDLPFDDWIRKIREQCPVIASEVFHNTT